MEALPAKRAIGVPRPPVQLLFAVIGRNEPLIGDQADDYANRERAAAKAEAEYLVFVGAIVAADEFVEIENIALEPPTECAAEQGQRLEGRCADAVIIVRNLIRPGEIEGLEH